MAADGTVEGVKKLMLEGLKDHIRGLAADGEELPPEPVETGHITINVPEPAHQG